MFGYEGNSNNLKVVETGGVCFSYQVLVTVHAILRVPCLDGGLDEIVDEMSGGKVLYAFLRVTDPNTQLPKNVLVNWVGVYACCSVLTWHALVW